LRDRSNDLRLCIVEELDEAILAELLHESGTPASNANCQKPSSARPIQLTINIDDAMAAKATMVLMDRII
jgi:hypothetical protein